MAAHQSLESAEGLSKHRIEALSDGIFAFAMTMDVPRPYGRGSSMPGP